MICSSLPSSCLSIPFQPPASPNAPELKASASTTTSFFELLRNAFEPLLLTGLERPRCEHLGHGAIDALRVRHEGRAERTLANEADDRCGDVLVLPVAERGAELGLGVAGGR